MLRESGYPVIGEFAADQKYSGVLNHPLEPIIGWPKAGPVGG
jgi:hypothetical protein